MHIITVQLFNTKRFLAYMALSTAMMAVFVVPLFWVSQSAGMFLMLGHVVSTLVFEHLTTPKIRMPNEPMSAEIRSHVAKSLGDDRWRDILGAVFMPGILFLFLLEKSGEYFAVFNGQAAAALAVFVVLTVWMNAQKAC